MNLFISYGHDEYKELAFRLSEDLEKQGYKIWIDKRTDGISSDGLNLTKDWRIEIEQGIENSDWFLLLMTKYSCRRPDGICLDEVGFARDLNKKIYPLMVEYVQPPLSVARIQYLDMTKLFDTKTGEIREDEYQKRFSEILDVFNQNAMPENDGTTSGLIHYLDPLDNDIYHDGSQTHFYGREKLTEYCEKWIRNEKDRILWLVGDAGVGKSSFIINLTEKNPEIKAVHFCKYNDNERSDAKRAIMSIAYYLSTQVDEYKTQLIQRKDIGNLLEKNAQRLFDYLIAEPLRAIKKPNENIVLVIDALDEAYSIEEGQSLIDVIAEQFLTTPEWLKLIITSRKMPNLLRTFSSLTPIDFGNIEFVDNDADLRGYFENTLKEELEGKANAKMLIEKLVKNSEGNFQYASCIVDDIKNNRIILDSPENFPKGLIGVYLNYFNRIFGQGKELNYEGEVRPLLEILCAELGPIGNRDLRKILDIDEYAFNKIKDYISQMFPERNGFLQPIHRSIFDWLTNQDKCGRYYISTKSGHVGISNRLLVKMKKGKYDEYIFRYSIKHFLRSDCDGLVDKAAEFLDNIEFQNERIQSFGVDSGLRIYLSELRELYNIEDDFDIEVEDVFLGDTFKELFTKYRTYLYNTGLFFSLEEIGLNGCGEKIYRSAVDNTDVQIALAKYAYITEQFENAIKLISIIFESDSLSIGDTVELSNLIALCYRKYAEFDKAWNYFENGWNSGQEDESIYEKSISAVNLAKISYHKLDWRGAELWNKRAIDFLQKAMEKSSNDDVRLNRELFLAEYHRLIAESVIWNFETDKAEENLLFTEKVYARLAPRDRYYIRFLYTSAFLKILKGKYQECIQDCHMLLKQAVSEYDKSQICFYMAMSYAALKDNSKTQEYVDQGIEHAEKISAWLEREEIVTLGNVMLDSAKYQPTEKCFENENISNWVKYEREFLNNTILRKDQEHHGKDTEDT